MHTRLATILLALCFLVSPAASESAESTEATEATPITEQLSCMATHSVECRGPSCQSEKDDTLRVILTVEKSGGKGELCTYTYCRDIRLVPNPGETVEQALAEWTGFTFSDKSGSTGDGADQPTIDYQVSISKDQKLFFLGRLGDGGFSGWTGSCLPLGKHVIGTP